MSDPSRKWERAATFVSLMLLLATSCAAPAAIVGCDASPSTTSAKSDGQVNVDLPVGSLAIGNRSFKLEIADTPKHREVGLMNRDSMDADHGMIFVFDDEQPLHFWMKNTRIGLDILFVDGTGRVTTVATMKPFDLLNTDSDGAARYAIELNAQAAKAAAVKVGDILPIQAFLAAHQSTTRPTR